MNDMTDKRPDPDEILASIRREEELEKRGRLKIFFGMCAGVGKTYSMLHFALAEKVKKSDVVIGYIEAHNRKEIVELTGGFELIPRKQIIYKGTFLKKWISIRFWSASLPLSWLMSSHTQMLLVPGTLSVTRT
jgi:two-component system sensor histidine kinase KdpD